MWRGVHDHRARCLCTCCVHTFTCIVCLQCFFLQTACHCTCVLLVQACEYQPHNLPPSPVAVHTQDANGLPPIVHASDIAAATHVDHDFDHRHDHEDGDAGPSTSGQGDPSTSGRGPSTPSRNGMSWRGWRAGNSASGRYQRFVEGEEGEEFQGERGAGEEARGGDHSVGASDGGGDDRHHQDMRVYEAVQREVQEALPAVLEPSTRAPPSLARAHRRQYASVGAQQQREDGGEGSEDEDGEEGEDVVAMLHAHQM